MAGNDQQLEGVHQDDIPQPVAIHGEMQHPRHIEVPNYNAAHYHLPPPPVSERHRVICNLSNGDTHYSIRRFLKFHMCKCIRMTELLNMYQPKRALLLRCVLGPFFSMYISNQIISYRASKRITKATVLTFPRATPPKLFPKAGLTQPHLRICHRRRMA